MNTTQTRDATFYPHCLSLQNKAEGAECSQMNSARERVPSAGPGELPQTSHYLYIANNAGMCSARRSAFALLRTVERNEVKSSSELRYLCCPQPSPTGLNSVNFLIPAGQPPAGIALNPTLAVPYVLVPSAALSHYPLVAGGLPQQISDGQSPHNNLSFSLPSVMQHPPFMVGTVPYSLAAGSERSPVPSPTTPEHSRVQGSLTGTPNSPSGSHQTVIISTPEPLVGRFP